MTSRSISMSRPIDADEQDAERVANTLSGTDAGTVHPAAVSPGFGGAVESPRGGSALDVRTRSWFESRLAAPLGNVRIHTDRSTADAARQLGARAFTINEHIGFGAGEYAPGTAEGHRLLAHELTHVVQQSFGPGAVEGAIQLDRPPTLRRKPVEGAEDPTVLGQKAATTALASRTEGTASALQRGTEADVADIRAVGGIEAFHAKLVDPKFDVLEKQIRYRSEEQQSIRESKLEGAWNALWTYGSNRRWYEDAVDWIQHHMEDIEKSRKDESQLVDQFNTWVPQGQQFYDAIVQMALKLKRLGLADGKDPEAVMLAFAAELWGELARSDALVKRAIGRHRALPEHVPRVDASVSALLGTMRADAAALHASWLGIQQTAIEERITSIKGEAKPDLKRMAEIDEAKEFVRKVGHIADLGLAATGKLDAAAWKIGGAAEKYRMYRLRKGVLKGDVDPEALPAEEAKEGEESGLPELSVEGVLGFVTDLAYSGEVKELKRRIAMVGSRAAAAGSVQPELEVQKREAQFIVALERLAATAAQLRMVLIQRREDYERLGADLDRLARDDTTAREKKFAPAPGREYFALGMSIVADVREAIAMGRSAASFAASELGFPIGFNERWSAFIRARTRTPERWNESLIRHLGFPAEETIFLRNIEQQLLTFHQKLEKFEELFKDVDAKASDLMVTLHPGAEPAPSATPAVTTDVNAGSY